MPAAFLYDNTAQSATLASDQANVPSMPLSNIQDPQPRRRVRLNASVASIIADLGANRAVDCAALISTTLGAGATVRARIGNEAGIVEAVPIVGLDFLTRDALPQMAAWTPARGGGGGTGEATYFNAAGNLQIAAAGEYRITHDPVTLERKGVLLEPGRVNGIRNPGFQGAAAGTPGTDPTFMTFGVDVTGLSKQIVATGTDNGLPYIDVRWFGTTTAAGRLQWFMEGGSAIAALAGQSFTISHFYKVVSGTYPVSNGVYVFAELNSGGTVLAQPLVASGAPFSSGTRISAARRFAVRALTNASVAFLRPVWFSDVIGSAVAVDVTIRFAAPQTELGTFATMPMLPPPGTTGATTRAADTGSLAIAVPSNFSLYSEAQHVARLGVNAGAVLHDIGIDDGGASNAFDLRLLDTATLSVDAAAVSAGSFVADFGNANISLGQTIRQAAAYAANDMAYSANGAAIETDTSGVLPALTRFVITQGEAITYLRRLRLYDRRLTNAQLVALSGTGSSLVLAEVTGDTGTIAAEAEDSNQGNVIMTLPAPAVGRYLRIDIENPTAAFTDIGVLSAGGLWRLQRGTAYGIREGRVILDRRDRNPFTGAEFPVPAIANPRFAAFTLPSLSVAEARGQHRALLAALGAAGDALWIAELNDTMAERNRRAIWGAVNAPGEDAAISRDSLPLSSRAFRIQERL